MKAVPPRAYAAAVPDVRGLRIPERTLHTLAFCGGWPGALLGQRHFRHKRQKLSFLVVFWALVALHVMVIAGLVYTFYRAG